MIVRADCTYVRTYLMVDLKALGNTSVPQTSLYCTQSTVRSQDAATPLGTDQRLFTLR
jgi:hypothetical protein